MSTIKDLSFCEYEEISGSKINNYFELPKPQMVDKSTYMESMWTFPFYEYVNDKYSKKRPSIEYVKEFLDRFLTELLNETSHSHFLTNKDDDQYNTNFVYNLPLIIDISDSEEEDKKINDPRSNSTSCTLALSNKHSSEEESFSEQTTLSKSLESQFLVNHFAGKLCLVIFDAEIRYLAKREIRKTLKDNKQLNIIMKDDEENIEMDRKNVENSFPSHVSLPIVSQNLSTMISIDYSQSKTCRHEDIIKDSGLKIQHTCDEMKPNQISLNVKKEPSEEYTNIYQRIKRFNHLKQANKKEELKGDTLTPKGNNIFKKFFFNSRSKKLKETEKNNRLLYQTRILGQLLKSKEKIAYKKGVKRVTCNEGKMRLSNKVDTKIGGKIEEVSIELSF